MLTNLIMSIVYVNTVSQFSVCRGIEYILHIPRYTDPDFEKYLTATSMNVCFFGLVSATD